MEAIFHDNILFVSLLVGILIITWQIYLLIKIQKSRFWEKTEGIIISSKLGVIETFGEVNNTYNSKVEYKYQTKDQTFISKRIYFGDKLSSSFKWKYMRVLAKYPVGRPVAVYYNPLNPKESVLEREININVILMLIIGFSLTVVSLYFITK